jgi:glycosyltransferase involved in cell wall biosynthesis
MLTYPDVSIIVPCFNEERHITGLLEAIVGQTISLEEIEVVIADGMSTDRTREKINLFTNNCPDLKIKLIDNPKRNIPAALNLAIQSATGKYIVRLDAHSIPEPDYVATCLSHLKENKAQNVGGIWVIKPGDNSQIASAISVAAAHPLGVGGAQYRHSNTQPAYVDTVPFGSFQRDFLVELGLFDESLLSNEDYELNTRIRKHGGKVFLDPAIRCTYFSRNNLKSLSKQYFRYGYWKFQMLKRYPNSIRPRQFLPPFLILLQFLTLILCLLNPVFIFVFFGIALLYLISIFMGTFFSPKPEQETLWMHLLIAIAIITMHYSWGTGFLLSPILSQSRRS